MNSENQKFNYFGYGSLTPDVVNTLTGIRILYEKAHVDGYELRILPADHMTEKERIVMEGGSRFIIVPSHGKRVQGWFFMNLTQTDVEFLKAFDNSSPADYYTHTEEVIEGPFRSRCLSKALLTSRNPYNGLCGYPVKSHMSYFTPYQPFSPIEKVGEESALNVAKIIRSEITTSMGIPFKAIYI